jgi:hypothetical protein
MWLRFGWAFPWQMGLFIAAATISGFTAFRKDAVIFGSALLGLLPEKSDDREN